MEIGDFTSAHAFWFVETRLCWLQTRHNITHVSLNANLAVKELGLMQKEHLHTEVGPWIDSDQETSNAFVKSVTFEYSAIMLKKSKVLPLFQ
jgi:hypothetical protein